jgi:hypothetical protein
VEQAMVVVGRIAASSPDPLPALVSGDDPLQILHDHVRQP